MYKKALEFQAKIAESRNNGLSIVEVKELVKSYVAIVEQANSLSKKAIDIWKNKSPNKFLDGDTSIIENFKYLLSHLTPEQYYAFTNICLSLLILYCIFIIILNIYSDFKSDIFAQSR